MYADQGTVNLHQPPIAIGRTAEVFAWGPGQVLKLDRPEMPGEWRDYEAKVGRIVRSGVGHKRRDPGRETGFIGTESRKGWRTNRYRRNRRIAMFNRILVPVDGSHEAARAVAVAMEEARHQATTSGSDPGPRDFPIPMAKAIPGGLDYLRRYLPDLERRPSKGSKRNLGQGFAVFAGTGNSRPHRRAGGTSGRSDPELCAGAKPGSDRDGIPRTDRHQRVSARVGQQCGGAPRRMCGADCSLTDGDPLGNR